jgi:hypothetical protein
MSTMDYHYETIGRVLAYLVDQGLKRVNLQTSDAMKIMTHRIGDEKTSRRPSPMCCTGCSMKG